MSGNSLIEKLQGGDQKALEQVYKKYRSGFIKWITYTHKCDHEEAVSIYKYSILSFYEYLLEEISEQISESEIKTYLYSVGKNKLLSDKRWEPQLSYQSEVEEELFESLEELNQEKENRLKKVKHLVNILGHPCSEILTLFYFNNMSNEDIAEAMGFKNKETVMNLKQKCVERLRKQLN